MDFSHLSSQLGTNYIPTEEEVLHIKTSLSDREAKLEAVEMEWKRLRAEVDGYRALISPARRLPPDILQEIFIRTLPTAHNALIDPNQCPMALTYVCNSWRKVALATPYLWSTIHIPVPAVHYYDPANQWEPMHFCTLSKEEQTASIKCIAKYAMVVTNWLKRSGAYPLSISLFDSPYCVSPSKYYDILIDSLLQFSTRWKDFVFESEKSDISRFPKVPDSFPLLERVTDGGVNSGLFTAPRLREITTEFMDIKLPINWGQLIVIKLIVPPWSLSNISLSNIAFILNMSPHLISCHFEIPLRDWRTPTLSSSPISLPVLETLVIHDGEADLQPLFELLNMPSLIHLEYFFLNPSGHRALSALLTRTATTIISFSTSYHMFAIANLEHYKCLSACHNLRTITTKLAWGPGRESPPSSLPYVGDGFLDILALNPTDPRQFAARVETIDWQACGTFTDAAILRFIKSRQSNPALSKLKKLSISLERRRNFDIFGDEEVMEIIKAGLDLRLEYPYSPTPKEFFKFEPSWGIPGGEIHPDEVRGRIRHRIES